MVQTFVWRVLAVEAWSPETPNLYRLEVRIEDGGAVLDRRTLTIRLQDLRHQGRRLSAQRKALLS